MASFRKAYSGKVDFPLALEIILLVLIGVLSLAAHAGVEADTANIERLSLGTNGEQGDGSSFFAYLSEDGRYAAFESWAGNWAADGSPNWVDVFVRDRTAGTTIKITYAHNGGDTDEDSFDPIMTADGRYIVYNSYATNLVPGDHNGDNLFSRDGLDLFLYDRLTGKTRRVSLTSDGGEINGNSVGTITPDGNNVIFASDGNNVIAGDSNGQKRTALYLRDWRANSIERITQGIDNQFPDAGIGGARASYDGRYIVYKASSTNLVPNDTNGKTDVFLYDRETGKTIRISQPVGGENGNGDSSSAAISRDGRYVAFRSSATNLTPGDTNGAWDIFVYTVSAAELSRVNVSAAGQQANGDSRDPSICGDGRFVSFTSEATNLVPGDTAGQRDVFLVDLDRGEIFAVTVNDSGQWGNGKAHRSYLAADCRSIAFSTEATNMIPDDTNGKRDLFISDVIWPADFSQSALYTTGGANPGETITYTITLRNTGLETATAVFSDTLPANATFIPSSLTGGAVYQASDNTVTWSSPIPGESEVTFSFAVTTDPGLTDFTVIENQATLTGDGQTLTLSGVTVLNGLRLYLPLTAAGN